VHHICQLCVKVRKKIWICNIKLKSYWRKYFFFRSSNCSSDDFWGELVDGCSVRESVTDKTECVYWDGSFNWCTYTGTKHHSSFIRFPLTNRERLTLSNSIFLPTAYFPALIYFGRERGCWITCNYPTVLKEKNIKKHKEYNLRYLLAKVCTTWGKASDRLRQQANKSNKNRVRHLPTLERNTKIILSDEVQRRIGKG
jgi:hypothetical protein